MGKSKRAKKKNTSEKTAPAQNSESATPRSEKSAKKKRESPATRSVSEEKIAQQHREEKRRRWLNRALMGVAVLAGVALIGYAVWSINKNAGLPNPNAKPQGEHYAVPLDATKSGISVGDPDAPQTLDIYLDYNCSACKLFDKEMKEIIEGKVEDNSVRVVYHPVGRLTSYSVLAAGAAGCAQDEGKYAEYSEKLFDKQGGDDFDDDRLKDIGKDVGLDSAEFRECVDNRTYVDWVLGINQEFLNAKYNGTPTVLVDGELIDTDNMGEMLVQTRDKLEGE